MSVFAHPVVDDLRAAYRRVVLHLAADDLTSASPEEMMPIVGERIAALVDATLDAALALARRDIDPEGRFPSRLSRWVSGRTRAQLHLRRGRRLRC